MSDEKDPLEDLETVEEDIRELASSVSDRPYEFDRHDLAIELESIDSRLSELAHDIRERLKEYE